MDCNFCQIATGTRPAAITLRVPGFVVFEPMTHAREKLLIVPTKHYRSLGDVPNDVLAAWLAAAHTLSTHVGASSYKVQINVGLAQQQVRHLYMQFTYTRE